MQDPNDDARSLRGQLAKLRVDEKNDRDIGYNAALHDAFVVLDRHERDRKKRSAKAIAQRKAAGKKIGGDLPYGYELAADGETLRESVYEQRVITTARRLHKKYSLREVARRLRADELFPREFLQGLTKQDEFHAAQIWRMLDEEE